MDGRNLKRAEFKISYSRINTYLFCPYKYKLVYIDGEYSSITGDISFGHTIHGALEKYHRQKNGSLEFLMECYDESWKNGGFKSAIETFEYYLRGKKMLENYFESFWQSKVEIIGIEKKFEANIGKYKFIGIIDRVDKMPDNSYEVIDYKTHANVWSQEKVDKDLQLSFYIYACRTILGINPKTAAIYFLSENKKIQTKRTSADIQEAIEIAIDCAQKINNDEFSPNTQNCLKCDFKERCIKAKHI